MIQTLITFLLIQATLTNSELTWPKVLLLGDGFVETCFSPTSPWCSDLADHLVRVSDVFNRGAWDYNTRFYLDVLHDALKGTPATEIALIILFIGEIDSFSPEADKTLAIPIDEYRSNLRAMVEKMEEKEIPRSTFMFVNAPPAIESLVDYRSAESATAYGDSMIEVAKDLGISWLNLRKKIVDDFKTESKWRTLFDPDTGKFNNKGSAYFFKLLWPVVQIKLKNFLGSEYLIKKFPMWSPSPSG